MREHEQISKWNAKGAWPEKPLINIRDVWYPVCCHGNTTVTLLLWGTSYCKESNISGTNWLRYHSSAHLIKNLVECMASLLD